MTGNLRAPCFHELRKDRMTDLSPDVSIPKMMSLTDFGNKRKFDFGSNTQSLGSNNSETNDEGNHRKNCVCELGIQKGFVCYGSKLTCSQRNHVRRLQKLRNHSKGPNVSQVPVIKSGPPSDHRGSRNSSCQRRSSPSPFRAKRIGNNETSECKNQSMGSNKKDKSKMNDGTSKTGKGTTVLYAAPKEHTKVSNRNRAKKTSKSQDRSYKEGKRNSSFRDEQSKQSSENESKPVKNDYILGWYVPRSTGTDIAAARTCKNNDNVLESQPISNSKENEYDDAQDKFEECNTESMDQVNVHYFAVSCQKHSTSEQSCLYDNPAETRFESKASKESYTNFRKTNYVKLEEQQINHQNVVNSYFMSSQTSSQSFQRRWSSKNDIYVNDEILCEGSQCTGRICTQQQSMKVSNENLQCPLESDEWNTKSFVITPGEISPFANSDDNEHNKGVPPRTSDNILSYSDTRAIIINNNEDFSIEISNENPNYKSDSSIAKHKTTDNCSNNSETVKGRKKVSELSTTYEQGGTFAFSCPLNQKSNRDVPVPSTGHNLRNETNQSNTKEILDHDNEVPLFIHNLAPENKKKSQPLNSEKKTDHLEQFPVEDTKQNPIPIPIIQKINQDCEFSADPKDRTAANTNLPSNNKNVSFSFTLQQTNNNKTERPIIHTSQNNETMKITVEVNATSSINSLCQAPETAASRRTKSANDQHFKRYEQLGQNTTKLLFQCDFNKANS